jgi:hypothetical protein
MLAIGIIGLGGLLPLPAANQKATLSQRTARSAIGTDSSSSATIMRQN